jgi:hypothetical protein
MPHIVNTYVLGPSPRFRRTLIVGNPAHASRSFLRGRIKVYARCFNTGGAWLTAAERRILGI